MTILNQPRTPSLVSRFQAHSAPSSHRTYTDAALLSALARCARSLGASPTIDQYNSRHQDGPHAHTIIDRFGSWNTALRKAGLGVHRRVTDQELLTTLSALAERLGHVPSPAEIEAARPATFSRSTYTGRFGSLARALRSAGLPVATNVDEQLDLAIKAGARQALASGRVPSMREWGEQRQADASLPSEWQIYRLCQGADMRPWQVFTQLVEDALTSA
jgi:hypothetical protein